MGQRGFKQLTARDRVLISKLTEKKLSISEIARRIGKNKSTISRELKEPDDGDSAGLTSCSASSN